MERLKKKITAIFEPIEIEKIAYETKFIQRSTSLLQGKDFINLMSAASLDPRLVPLVGLCSNLREIQSKGRLDSSIIDGEN